MSASKPLPTRYAVLKALHAVEAAVASVAASGKRLSFNEAVSQAASAFKDAYAKPLTTVMYMAGAAMCPNINKAAATDSDAVEKLVVRLISRPSPRNLFVGDVVAFQNPLDTQGQHTMVRRVAALEAHEMVSDDADEPGFRIPPGHCWVLADNEKMVPPDVIDSRAFGYLPLDSILGRIIYRVRAPDAHGVVDNSPMAALADAPVIDAEVDAAQLAASMDDGSGGGGGSGGAGAGGE